MNLNIQKRRAQQIVEIADRLYATFETLRTIKINNDARKDQIQIARRSIAQIKTITADIDADIPPFD